MSLRRAQKRPYRMGARALAAQATVQRVKAATLALFNERFIDEITLDAIAARAGVTVKTVLRRFGSRDGLLEAVADHVNAEVAAQRLAAPVGDVAAAVDNLLEDYERWGDAAMRALAQEERSLILRRMNDAGRTMHRAWVEQTFAPQLATRAGEARRQLFAALVAITDVYVWKLLRRDQGFDVKRTRRTLLQMLNGCLAEVT